MRDKKTLKIELIADNVGVNKDSENAAVAPDFFGEAFRLRLPDVHPRQGCIFYGDRKLVNAALGRNCAVLVQLKREVRERVVGRCGRTVPVAGTFERTWQRVRIGKIARAKRYDGSITREMLQEKFAYAQFPQNGSIIRLPGGKNKWLVTGVAFASRAHWKMDERARMRD